MKQWQHFPDSCDYCGNDLKVFTESDQEGFVFDGDDIRCVECSATGYIDVRDEDDGRIEWRDQESAGGASKCITF